MSPQVGRSTGLAMCAQARSRWSTRWPTQWMQASNSVSSGCSSSTVGRHATFASSRLSKRNNRGPESRSTSTSAASGRTSSVYLNVLTGSGSKRTHRQPPYSQVTQPRMHSRTTLRSQSRRIIHGFSSLPSAAAAAALLSSPSPFSAPTCPPTTTIYIASSSFHNLSSSSSTVDSIPTISSARGILPHLAPVRGQIRTLPTVMGSSLKQTRDHGDHGHGHSHGGHGHHHHHHDSTYLTSANKNDPGVRITRIGLLSNLGMAIAKFIGGWAFNSKSMTADAWHSIADLASDILTLATVSWSLKPPTDRFPMGFGKVESLGSLGVSGMLLVGGLYMGWESAISLYGHFNPEGAHHIFEHVGHGHSHSHSPADLGIPSIHAVWLAAGTILIKEWLYHATMKVARERKSSVLASNAIHHRVDSLTGIVTLAAILGANVVENAAWLDPVGGLLISIMVVKAGYDNTKEAMYELADRSLDDEVKSSVRKQAHRALANISEGHEAELREISGTKSGQNYMVDVEMAVPGAWTVDDVKDLEDAVRMQVGSKVRGVRRLRVRFVSRDKDVNEKFDEFISGQVALQKPEPEEGSENGDVVESNGKHRH